MTNTLKAEWFKFKKSRAARICLIILLAYIALEIIIYTFQFLFYRDLLGDDLGVQLLGMFGIRYSADAALTFFSSDSLIVTVIATVIICGFYSAEYRQGLIRNSICTGAPRSKVYLAKFLMAMIVCAAFYCVITFLYMAVLGIMGGWGPFAVYQFIGFWFLQLLLFLAMGSFIFMLSMITKSTGATIGITLGVILLLNLFALLGALGAVASEFEVGNNIMLVVLNEISMLFPAGQIGIVAGMELEGWRLLESILVGIGFLVGSGAIGMAVFKKQDQK